MSRMSRMTRENLNLVRKVPAVSCATVFVISGLINSVQVSINCVEFVFSYVFFNQRTSSLVSSNDNIFNNYVTF